MKNKITIMNDSKNSESQEQNKGNIQSPKQKGQGKYWSKEEMDEAKPYPLPGLPVKRQRKSDGNLSKQKETP